MLLIEHYKIQTKGMNAVVIGRSNIVGSPISILLSSNFFFFQAEDGIRDYRVTGVQTCALPINDKTAIRDYRVTGVQTCALPIDRKSTRLNSSHTIISYAVSLVRKTTRLTSSKRLTPTAASRLKKKTQAGRG